MGTWRRGRAGGGSAAFRRRRLMRGLQARTARAIPFYYGWVILALSGVASYSSRPLMAVAVLTVFVVPMEEELGWSRTAVSAAVSLGGVCAVVLSPLVGPLIDRYGSGLVVGVSSGIAGLCAVGLGAVHQIGLFYLVYVPGRAVFASPLELGTATAVSNWFIRRRPFALALNHISQGSGLAVMPLAAQAIIGAWSWQTAWYALGAWTLAVGVAPAIALMARRPEDLGLEVDGGGGGREPGRTASSGASSSGASSPGASSPGASSPGASSPGVSSPGVSSPGGSSSRASSSGASASSALSGGGPGGSRAVSGRRPLTAADEINFTLGQAMRAPAFWLMMLFAFAGFIVQAGVSLHQVPHFEDQGIPDSVAVWTASTFAISQVPASVLWSLIAQRAAARFVMPAAGLVVAGGAVVTAYASDIALGVTGAFILGFGVGGLHIISRLTWADYFGRLHLGAIRAWGLAAQVAGQALGPTAAGIAVDGTGSYQGVFTAFGVNLAVVSLLMLTAARPGRPAGE